MRSRTILVCVALAGIALAGCGGGSTTTATVVRPPGVTPYAARPPVKSVTYNVTLSPKTQAIGGHRQSAPGAPGASALAVLSVNAATNELCWTFSQLKNIENPTVARVYRHPGGYGPVQFGFKLEPKFTLSGCTPENTVFLGLLGAKPEEFFVSIHSMKYPQGAVRGEI